MSANTGNTDKAGTPLIAAGAVVAALGAGASSLIAVGAINGKRAREDQQRPGYTDEQRDRIDKQGKTANSLFIAGLVATPVLLGTGVALIVVGVKKNKRGAMQASVAPMLERGVAGVSVSGRF